MYGTSGYVIDIESLNLMTLETIFYKDRYDALARLIVEQIVKDKKLREPSQLQEEGYFSVDEIVPTDNFIIDAKGITWFYNPYEIAVYSTGQTTVSLPWDAVKEFLMEDSPVYFLIERINK